MKLKQVTIENYRAIESLELPLHPQLTVLHGDNGHGKTSVLSAIAKGLGSILLLLPGSASLSSSEHNPELDYRLDSPQRIALTTTDDMAWEVGGNQSSFPRELQDFIQAVKDSDCNGETPIALPIVAFYNTDRSVVRVQEVPTTSPPQKGTGIPAYASGLFGRNAALLNALSGRADFQSFSNWFYDRENDEMRRQRQRGSFDYRLNELEAVRHAVVTMIPGVSEPRMETNPTRFVVSVESESGKTETLDMDQLSGGYRIMLALAADLAHRMAQGNPHLDDPLQSEAIVLIDEVDLHLHPSWQQRVLPDLMRTFPNAQFIVSTHSPQVLTTVKPEHIMELHREGNGVVAGPASSHTYGAEAGDVLDAVMRVDERPPNNEFVSALNKYMRLVDDGLGEADDAKILRAALEKLSPRDPALDRADMEIWRHQFLRNMEESQ